MPRRQSKELNTNLQSPGAPLWMVTYGDMMTLLLVFFVLIVSFSTIEIEKFKAALGSFRGALMPWAPAPTGMSMLEQPIINIADHAFTEAVEKVEEAIENTGLNEFVEVHQVPGGIKVILSDPVLFDVGRDDLKLGAIPILRSVLEVALNVGAGEIEIEGHTDDTPIKTKRFPSNWDLSAARALKVLKLYQKLGFPPDRLVAVGYGEFRPKFVIPSTASHAEKAPNRRVEIFLNMEIQEESLYPGSRYENSGGWGD